MKYKLDYYKILGYALIPMNIILIALLELDFLGKLPAYWNSIYVFYLLLIVNTAFLALRINHMKEEDREHDYTVFWAKYLFLLGLVVLAINQFLKRQIIIDYMGYIIGFVIALGFFTFFASRERVEKEIEEEKTSEEEAEKKRKDEFSSKFTRINKIWGLRSIVKWMHKDGWWYVLLLLIIIVLGFTLRVWNVGNIDLVNDEYRHLNAMKHFYQNGFFEQPRSQITTWLLICIKYFVSYDNYFAFKLPFVILGTISIILIYFLSKSYIKNKKIALFSSYLFATLPLAIGLARYIREYEIAIFLMLVSIILIKKFNSIIINGFVLLFWLFFYNIIGSTSIMILGIIFIIFFLDLIKRYILLSNRWKILKNYRLKLIFITLILLLICFMLFNYSKSIHPINKGFLFLFNFPAVPHQFDANPIGYTWFTPIVPFGFILIILSFFIHHFYLEKSTVKKIDNVEILMIFMGTIIYFLFIENFQFIWQARYLYYLFPFYIIVISISILYFFNIIKIFLKKNNKLPIIILLIFLLLLFSPYNAINDLVKEKSGESNYFHGQPTYPDKELCTFLIKNNITPNHIIVAKSWSLDYCLDSDFLKDSEKKQYIYFPNEESYDYYDRTKILTTNSYIYINLKDVSEMIKGNNITFLIISKDFINNKIYPDFSSILDFNFKLTNQIPTENVRYKYLIYKIEPY